MASGAANMLAFEYALDEHDIKWSEVGEEGRPTLRIGFALENVKHVDVFFWFDEDGTSVRFGTGPVASVPASKSVEALRAVNAQNLRYRWLGFFLNEEGDIMGQGDAILVENFVGDNCLELLHRTLNIVDEAYPSLMRAIWAD